MNTSTIGFLVMVGALVACGDSVEPAGGNGAGGESEGGGEVGGEAPIGGNDIGGSDAGGAGEGGVGQGGAAAGGAGEGGAPTEACALMALVDIAAPELVDAGGDLVWSPGESATFVVTLANNAGEDNFHYPGVQVSSPMFGIEGGNNTLFGIFTGEATEVMVGATASDAFQSGTEVELLFSVTTLAEGCDPSTLGSVGLTVTLE
jgi:hypothetical protein